jgi:FtsH-binding integral membrane protein
MSDDFYAALERDLISSDEQDLYNTWWWFGVMIAILILVFILTVFMSRRKHQEF